MLDNASPRQVWEAALGELQIQVNRPNYETWLRRTVALGHDDGKFTVGVPNTFVAEYLDRNQRSLIEKVLTGLLHREVRVGFRVEPGSGGVGAERGGRAAAAPPQQGNLPLFNPKYTFDSFVTGRSNQFACAAAAAVAEKPGQAYNPLFVYGGPGLGKTHLLQAIGHQAAANDLKVIYVSAEQYTNDLMNALRERATAEFYQKYRSVDMLLVDDVQFFSGKQKTAENFFHTFDELHNAGRQIAMTSDRPPQAIPLLPEGLRSRFEWGLITEVQPPDFETRLAILQEKASEDRFDLNGDVLDFLARQIQHNVRVLEGSLNRVIAYARLVRAAVTPQLAAHAIRDIGGNGALTPAVTATSIVEAVARHFQMSPADVVGKRRDKEAVTARRLAMYLVRHHTGSSLNQVGQELGGRDPAAVTNACKKVAGDIETNPYLRRQLLDIKQALGCS